MPKRWQDEVREILERSDRDWTGRRDLTKTPRAHLGLPVRRFGGGIDAIGEWVRRRFSSTADMLVTAAVLVVLALLLSVLLRQLASVLAIAGAIVFAVALARGIIGRRGGGASVAGRQGPVMWRGQVIELPPPPRPSVADRFRAWWRRRR